MSRIHSNTPPYDFKDTQFEEHLFCEVDTGYNENILIGSLYRSSSRTDNNFEQLCKIFKESTKLQFSQLLIGRDNVITPTLNTPTVITPTHNTSTVTNSLCYSGAFSNPNAVRDCPFNLKGGWFLSRCQKFFLYAALLFLKLFSAAQQNIFYKRKFYFM